MSDVIYQGATWRREITILDESGAPVTPSSLMATLCPSTSVTISAPSAPGVYTLSLTAAQTDALPAPFVTHLELLGIISGDTVPLTKVDISIQPLCATFP